MINKLYDRCWERECESACVGKNKQTRKKFYTHYIKKLYILPYIGYDSTTAIKRAVYMNDALVYRTLEFWQEFKASAEL